MIISDDTMENLGSDARSAAESQPAASGPLYGAPLFGRTPDEAARRREPFLLASSDAPCAACCATTAGRSLYRGRRRRARRDNAYDLSDGGLGSRMEITEAMRALNRGLIRQEIAKFVAQYPFRPQP